MPVIGGAFSRGFQRAADSLIGIILGLAQRNRGRKTSRLNVPARPWRVGRTRKSVAFLPRLTNARRPARCRISVQILLVCEHLGGGVGQAIDLVEQSVELVGGFVVAPTARRDDR
jgi:hypothetical protein